MSIDPKQNVPARERNQPRRASSREQGNRASDQLIEKLRGALQDGTFVKLTLSAPRTRSEGLRNVYGRLVELREGPRVSMTWRYATRDETKNVPVAEAPAFVADLLRTTFADAHLFTAVRDFVWREQRGLKAHRPRFTVVPEGAHDLPKTRTVSGARYLTLLGVTNAAGEARPGMADKLRQIQRYVEILGHLVAGSSLRDTRELRAIDLGAGKGYLTFAAYDFFNQRQVAIEMTGVESREELVTLTNRVAEQVGFSRLKFFPGTIASCAPEDRLDFLMALHACDTATDDALHLGIRAGAALIVAAPCCHREVRPQVVPAGISAPVWRHGILAERSAEIVTDALRALLLEIHGYKAEVFEFISAEHTSKNLMIAAQRRSHPADPGPLRKQFRELIQAHGIREQRLARLLGEL